MWSGWSPELDGYPAYLHARLKKGWGLGEQISYQPWLRVQDVPSEGTSGPPGGIKVRRIYHLLSTPERIYFYLLDRDEEVIDIREQFPILDVNSTLKLAAARGIKHPSKGRFPEPFTIDFLVTRRTAQTTLYQARSIKTPADADDPEVRRRLSVEHAWCQENGIDWQLVDTKEFSVTMHSTLIFMRGWFRHRYAPNDPIANRFAEAFHGVYQRNLPLSELLSKTSELSGLGMSKAGDHFRYCAWTDRIAVDLTQELRLDRPVVLRDK